MYAIAVVVLFILTILLEVSLLTFIISVIGGAVELILIWALDNCIFRIEVLENILNKKGIVEERDVQIEVDGFVDEKEEDINYCKHCGYQLFKEDKVCPNCGEEVETEEASEELK
ncbi:MAG: zinc ribbon domain-containing protein [Clostridia bacterium]|nr:zinc ribbon domain-containing protein [Clostridia bacterium]